jgi:hypothetical protein
VPVFAFPSGKEAVMYDLDYQPAEEFPYALVDENGLVVGRLRVAPDALEVVAALNLLERAVERFPGLVDGETPVSGTDFIDLFSEYLQFHDGRYRSTP